MGGIRNGNNENINGNEDAAAFLSHGRRRRQNMQEAAPLVTVSGSYTIVGIIDDDGEDDGENELMIVQNGGQVQHQSNGMTALIFNLNLLIFALQIQIRDW